MLIHPWRSRHVSTRLAALVFLFAEPVEAAVPTSCSLAPIYRRPGLWSGMQLQQLRTIPRMSTELYLGMSTTRYIHGARTRKVKSTSTARNWKLRGNIRQSGDVVGFDHDALNPKPPDRTAPSRGRNQETVILWMMYCHVILLTGGDDQVECVDRGGCAWMDRFPCYVGRWSVSDLRAILLVKREDF